MQLPSFSVEPKNVDVLLSAKDYFQRLIALIEQAKTRIYITALYLENDAAGKIVLEALFRAKQNRPALDVCVFVDAHRAQRGLIGQERQMGNRTMYIDFAEKYADTIGIFGVLVKRKEWLGVLHLKGMVFDDELLYSGASINNVYLHHENKYRLDRYYHIQSEKLSDSFVGYLQACFVNSGVSIDLTSREEVPVKQQKLQSKKTGAIIKKSRYSVVADDNNGLQITPLVGCGKRQNKLNQAILQLIKESREEIIIFTPYFNLPKPVLRLLVKALKRGCKITFIVGDKTASDFFIDDENNFSLIGLIPYLYEQILYKFLKRWQKYIDSKQLTIQLWRDGHNSFHTKGMVVDKQFHLVTGSNLNPRAWSLDLENGLLICDQQQSLSKQFHDECRVIFSNTTEILHYSQIDSVNDYPTRVKKLLRRLSISKIDRILRRFL